MKEVTNGVSSALLPVLSLASKKIEKLRKEKQSRGETQKTICSADLDTVYAAITFAIIYSKGLHSLKELALKVLKRH